MRTGMGMGVWARCDCRWGAEYKWMRQDQWLREWLCKRLREAEWECEWLFKQLCDRVREGLLETGDELGRPC